jgi:4-methyl-5(b-hydroxyethyl)-thiazole monophosphate biosynthesis
LLEENLSQYNAIYLPGGKGYLKFNDTNASKLVKFVQKNYNNPKMYFMALCAAPVCFYNWGIITPNLQLTCYPGMQIGKFEKNYVNKPVVVSNNFVTGSGPGTAHIFALTVVELLCGRQIAEEIAQKTLFK